MCLGVCGGGGGLYQYSAEGLGMFVCGGKPGWGGGRGGGGAQGSPDHPSDVLQGCNYETDVPGFGLIFEHDYVSLSVHQSV